MRVSETLPEDLPEDRPMSLPAPAPLNPVGPEAVPGPEAITALPGLFAREVAIVTGAARGNGAAIARGLAASGAAVALADLELEGCAALAEEILAAGGRAAAFALDVADRAACLAFAAAAEAALGPAAVLVNNAGIVRRAHPAEPHYLEELDALLAVNVTGSANMAVACLDQLRRTGGRVVNIASIAGFITNPGTTHYSASKGAVVQLTKGLAAELLLEGILGERHRPGGDRHPDNRGDPGRPGPLGRLLAHTPMGRVGQPEELVGPVLFLASRLSTYVTGAVLAVDGGRPWRFRAACRGLRTAPKVAQGAPRGLCRANPEPPHDRSRPHPPRADLRLRQDRPGEAARPWRAGGGDPLTGGTAKALPRPACR